jgi:hypothetical protein
VVLAALASDLAAASTSSSRSRVVRIMALYLMILHQVMNCECSKKHI